MLLAFELCMRQSQAAPSLVCWCQTLHFVFIKCLLNCLTIHQFCDALIIPLVMCQCSRVIFFIVNLEKVIFIMFLSRCVHLSIKSQLQHNFMWHKSGYISVLSRAVSHIITDLVSSPLLGQGTNGPQTSHFPF